MLLLLKNKVLTISIIIIVILLAIGWHKLYEIQKTYSIEEYQICYEMCSDNEVLFEFHCQPWYEACDKDPNFWKSEKKVKKLVDGLRNR